ncbi:MAG: hypothetical protein ACLTSX_13450 [Collinsella sp.]
MAAISEGRPGEDRRLHGRTRGPGHATGVSREELRQRRHPFFTNLALWVAGFILMAMVKLRVDPEGLPKFTAVQAYFGRWLFYMVCGLAMGSSGCVGDLALGIQCEKVRRPSSAQGCSRCSWT